MGLKADTTNASENGAGYVSPGETGGVFLDLVNRVVNSQSQVVVAFGSDNDTGAHGLPQAVQSVLARIKVLACDGGAVCGSGGSWLVSGQCRARSVQRFGASQRRP